MSKPKDHLFYPIDIARSVLTGKTVKAACGLEKVITRESVEDLVYRDICRHCVAEQAHRIEPGKVARTRVKRGWTDLLEAAFLAADAQRYRPYTITYNTTTWTNASTVS